jgi:hypothetical protein
MNDRLKKLEELLKLLNEGLTREEFLDAFKKVLEIIVQIKNRNEQAVELVEKTYSNLLGKVDTEKTSTLAEIRNEAKNKLNELLKTSQEKFWSLDLNFSTQKEQIIAEALARIIFPEYKEFILEPKEIRDKLELLKGKERLDIKAIDGIEKLFEELEKLKKQKGIYMGGGFNYSTLNMHLIDDETPTGTVNGVNTDFTIAHIPSPTSSLKVYVNGQRMRITTDYTFSGQIITFLTAPPTGSILLVDYRI